MSLSIKNLTLSLLSFCTIIFLTSRYLPIETDALNSPIVWREVSEHGFGVLKSWYATPDNWYFTVYPINFFFYFLFGNDGIVPLTLSTALFACVTAISFWYVANRSGAGIHSYLVVISLTLMPAYAYTFGFIAHPFSHYSTTAYGALCVAIMIANIGVRSYALVALISIISIFTGASDPWYLASFFLPMLLIQVYLFWNKHASLKDLVTYLISFITSISGIVQSLFNIPVEHFKLTTTDQMLLNIEVAFTAIGRMLNPFFVNNSITLALSLLIWIPVSLYSAWVCFKGTKESSSLAVLACLSISAIISSFILSFEHVNDMNARFFGNVPAFVITLCAICAAIKRSRIISALLILFCLSSLYSYTKITHPMFDQGEKTAEIIKFLTKNDLSYGYSNTVQYATTTNWMSNGDIKIIPVYQNPKTGYITKEVVRGQTMKYWLSDEYISKSPRRQFFAVTETIRSCKNKDVCINYIKRRIGEPDDILTFKNITFLVYNRQINF